MVGELSEEALQAADGEASFIPNGGDTRPEDAPETQSPLAAQIVVAPDPPAEAETPL